MLELLQVYSLQDIIVFIVLLAMAVKGCFSFIEWANEKIKKSVYRADEPRKLKQHIQSHEEQISDLKAALSQLKQMTNLLIQSDRDDIKAFLTREHHYFVYQKGWIDDYSLNCIEKRFSHYKDQGGNSFIKDLMEDIRKLPKHPYNPLQIEKQQGGSK